MRSPVAPDDFDAVLFDLDGVLTTTATLHEAAWRSAFDTFLDEWDAAHGTSTARFEVADYAAYVDGKPRQDGARDFLEARHHAASGTPDAPPSTRTVWGPGNLRTRMYRTAGSGPAVAAAMDHSYDPATLTHMRTRLDRDGVYVVFAVRAAPGQAVTPTKWLAYHYGSRGDQRSVPGAAGPHSRGGGPGL